jgi:DNA-binding response OmpR family regulator
MNGFPFCRRCGAEIATANLMDVDPGIDRAHFSILLLDARRRQLSPGEWRLFAALYGRHGRIVPPAELVGATGIAESGLREQIRRLRQLLVRSRFQLITHRAHGYELIVRADR